MSFMINCVRTHKIKLWRSSNGASLTLRGRVQNEFVAGRDYIDAEYRIRLQADWQGLPLKALVCGHHNLEVVIRGLLQCLMMFGAFTDVELATCGHAMLLFFGRGSPLRDQIVCLVHRTHQLDALPGLSRLRAASQQVPVIEVSVERHHAQVHTATRAAPNRTAAYDSIKGLRKNHAMRIFDDTPETVQGLAKVFDSDSRSSSQYLDSLGLLAHPAKQNLTTESGMGFDLIPHHIAADAIYRGDVASQSQIFAAFQAPPPPDLKTSGTFGILGPAANVEPAGDHGIQPLQQQKKYICIYV